MGVFKNKGYHFGGLHNKDCSILGSILQPPYLWKLPNLGPREERSVIVKALLPSTTWVHHVRAATCSLGCWVLAFRDLGFRV